MDRWEQLSSRRQSIPVNETLELRIEEDDQRDATFDWIVPQSFSNSVGNLQGGVFAILSDALMGAAASARLPEDNYPALAEIKVSYFRPARVGSSIRGRGSVIKAGKQLLFCEAVLTAEDGTMLAKASGTQLSQRAKSARDNRTKGVVQGEQ